MKKILFNLAALLALTHVTHASEFSEDPHGVQTRTVEMGAAEKAKALHMERFQVELKRTALKYPAVSSDTVMYVLNETGLLYSCGWYRELEIVFETVRDYNEELLKTDIAWVKKSGFLEAKFPDPYNPGEGAIQPVTEIQLCSLLACMRKCTPIQRSIILPWMCDLPVVKMCAVWSVYEMPNLFGELCRKYDAEEIAPALAWLKNSGALLATGESSGVFLTKQVLSFPRDKLESSEKWMKESGAWDMCAKSSGLALPNLLITLKNYSYEDLRYLGDWMKASGFWAKCEGKTFFTIMENLRYPNLDVFKKGEGWFKKLGIWETYTAVELSEKLNKLKFKQSGSWFLSLEKLMQLYDGWCEIGEASAIKEFVINSF